MSERSTLRLAVLGVLIVSLLVTMVARLFFHQVVSADVYTVPAEKITEQVTVLGTWLGGKKIDTDAFINNVTAIDPTEHRQLSRQVGNHRCC